MEFEIRPARPDDAAFLGWVIFAAGRSHCQRGVWDIIFGMPENECITFLEHLTVTEAHHMFHYSDFIIAEVDGCPVAALSGYDHKQLVEVGQAFLQVHEKLGWTEDQRVDNQKGVAAILHCYPEETEGAWIIESVATLPEVRRQGMINILMKEILEKGRRLGFGLAQVGVFIGNTPAQNAYEKCGFRVIDEKRHPDFEAETGSPGMKRLLLDL